MGARSRPLSLAGQLAAAVIAAAVAIALSVDYSSAQLISQPPALPDGPPPKAKPQDSAPGSPGRPTRPGRRPGKPNKAPAKPPPAAPAPAPADGAGDENERLGRDPFAAMGGNSPFCAQRGLGARERANCEASGALSHPQRIDHYAFDIHIDTGVDNIGGNISAALQALVQLGWMGLLYVVKGVTLLLEWSFSLDLLGEAMSGVRQALGRLHNNVFGQVWFLAAISAAGLWAIWRGFVQRKTIQTATGLAATVALMVIALLIINSPAATVGRANRLANQASLGIVSGATTGSVSGSARGFGQAMTRVFDQAVLRPWCALEFSDVAFCLANPRKVVPEDDLPDDPDVAEAWASANTVAEMFLAFEANGEDDVDQRNAIYEDWKDNDGGRLQAVVRMQKEGSTGSRIALFCLIAIGLLGMVCLFGWVGLRLLGYGVLALVLVLFAPIALLMAALGDSGRQSFIAWAKRLLGALVAKAVYAIFLALVLVASAALAELDSLGFIAVWLLQTVFWWTLFLKRDDIIQFASAPGLGPAEAQSSGSLMQRLYHAGQVATMAKRGGNALRDKGGQAAALAGRPATAGLDKLHRSRATTSKATSDAAQSELAQQARARLAERHQQAGATVERDEHARGALTHVDRGLRNYDERATLAHANGAAAPAPTESEQVLLARRAELAAQRPPAPAVAAAREQVRHAQVNRARTGSPVSPQDERAHIAQRRRELATLPANHPRNLQASGIDPAAYRQAAGPEREQLDHQAARALERESALLAAAPDPRPPAGDGTPPAAAAPSRGQLREAKRVLDPEQIRDQRAREIEARRAARRAAKQRERLERNRSARAPDRQRTPR